MEAALVNRVSEMETIRGAIAQAAKGNGTLLLLRGEAGTGKTRLAEEAAEEARRSGFHIGHGSALPESPRLYQCWTEALGPLGLDHLLRDEPPPRLIGLYLLGGGGLPAGRAERPGVTADPEIFAAMSNAVADFLRHGLARVPAAPGAVEGDILRFAHESLGICVVRARGFALVAVAEGRENELFIQEMRQVVDEVERRAGGSLRAWDGSTMPEIGEMLRAVLSSGKYDGVDTAADGQARKFNLYDNVLFGLRRKSALCPLMVVLDDLQWADPSSLGLLHYLARNIRRDRILVVGSYRTEEAGVQEHLRDMLLGLGREDLAVEVPVGPLTPDDTRAYAGRLIGPNDIQKEFFDLLARETGGNPLFVREVLRALGQENAFVSDGARRRLSRPLEHLEVPGKIRDAVVMRLKRLTEEERALLDAASVCGIRFGGALVARLIGEPEGAVLRRLTSVSRVHAMVRSEGRVWRFDHPAVQYVLYRELPADLRDLYHRAAADALAELSGGEEEVGYHYAAAGDPRAIPHLRKAAGAAMVRGAPDEAVRMLKAALGAGPGSGAGRAGMEEALAEALNMTGRYDHALAALDRAQADGSPPGRCALRRLDILEKRSDFAEALCLAETALSRAAGDEAVLLEVGRARVLMRMGRLAEGVGAAEAALARFPENEKGGRGDAMNTLGICYSMQGRWERALEFFREALRLREEAGDRRGVASSLNNIALEHEYRGDYDAALGYFRKSLALYEMIGDRYHAASSHSNIGEVFAKKGEPRVALEHLERGIEIFRSIGDRRLLSDAHSLSVTPRLALGQAAAARADAELALRLARELGSLREEAHACRALGETAAAEGDMAGARRSFAEAVRVYEKFSAAYEVAETCRLWGEAAAAAGLAGEAREHLEKAAGLFDSLNLTGPASNARGAMRRV